MMSSRSRRRRPRTRPHSKFNSDSMASRGNNRGRSKFAIFIRDVPSIEHTPIAKRLLGKLARLDIYPVYYYSVAELLKDKRNVEKMRSLGNKHGGCGGGGGRAKEPNPTVLVKGCNVFMRHLFERAIRSTPELIVVDYMSETLVDVTRFAAVSRKLNYNVIFLKKKFYGDCDDDIDRAVKAISGVIKYQNHAEIWCQREADKWWHEMEKIYLPSHGDFTSCPASQPLQSLAPTASESELPVTRRDEVTVNLMDRALHYLDRLENLAKLLDGDTIENDSPLPSNTSESHATATGSAYTLIVVDDFPLDRPGKPRLFELFMGKLQLESFSLHVIPVGSLVILPKFQMLLEWFCTRSDMDLMDTYSFLFLDAFNTLYNNEKVVILDNVHEGIVMSSYYITRAVENQWEVIIMTRDKCWPPRDSETVEEVVAHLKKKYGMQDDDGMQSSLSGRNYALGDYFEYV